jgi:bacillithiol synthase
VRALGPAWLRGEPSAASLLDPPVGPEGFDPPPARALHDGARSTLAALNPGRDVDMDAAIVTGQQLGLFGGPCFTLYKAWTAVAWARALSRRWGRRVRPIFWLQTEDHDFAEIAWCGCPDGTRVEISKGAPSRASVSERRVPEEIDGLLAEFVQALGPGPHRDPITDRLSAFWSAGASWTEAFSALLRWTFQDTELLLFDPRHPAAAAAAAAIHERALFGAAELAEGLRAQASEIEAAGFDLQVPLRSETLSFVHLDGPSGDRQRLRWESGAARCPDGRGVDGETLRRWLAEEPRRFTSSALLRPIVQDFLLPTAGYVAGPGEIAYWAQLPPLYAAWSLDMPRVLPRARVRLVEPWARRLLAR